jgi:hypothetical protein
MSARFGIVIVACAAAVCALSVPFASHAQNADDVGWRSALPVVTFAGSYSGVTEREYHRVMDNEAWRDLWTRHAGGRVERDSYSEIVAPIIDFERHMVIAIFNGDGWNTRNMRLEETSDHTEFRIRFDAGTYQTASGNITPIVIEGDVTPETVEEIVLEDAKREDAARQAGKHEDPNYTSAYGIFVLPRTDKPIVLIENVQGIIGEPPVWEEKQRFEAVK